ncbi:MAG: dTMP kinase [Thermodesulfovibrionales bacterium]
MKGFFLSLEGIEGTGKSTQARLLAEHLRSQGRSVVLTAEPGGTKIGTRIREVLLSTEHAEMAALTELLLYNAARAQHLSQLILPALERGETVITDRFSDSTMAYQGFGRGLDPGMIDELDQVATGRLRPDLTIVLDIDVPAGLRRNREANKVDRLEQEEIAFHERVRRGFIQLVAREPKRMRMIDASAPVDEVHRLIAGAVADVLKGRA